MTTKTCPSCGTEVPKAAPRCKECFHDFSDSSTPRSGPISLLIALAAMALVGAATIWFITNQPAEQRYLVDAEARAIIWTTQFQDGSIQTDRLAFDEIDKVEYVLERGGSHTVYAVTLDGTQKVITSSPNQPLRTHAEKWSSAMDKPLNVVDNTGGFGMPSEE